MDTRLSGFSKFLSRAENRHKKAIQFRLRQSSPCFHRHNMHLHLHTTDRADRVAFIHDSLAGFFVSPANPASGHSTPRRPTDRTSCKSRHSGHLHRTCPETSSSTPRPEPLFCRQPGRRTPATGTNRRMPPAKRKPFFSLHIPSRFNAKGPAVACQPLMCTLLFTTYQEYETPPPKAT